MLITTPCPQCGGDIEFLDEAQAVKCQYCDSLLQLAGTEGVRRYYLEPRADKKTVAKALIRGLYQKKRIKLRSLNSQLIFYPYWWVKGMVFKWILGKKTIPSKISGVPDSWENVKKLKTHLFDHTFPANGEIVLGPSSLGIRTGAMRVRAYNRKEMQKWGLPLKVTVSHKQAVDFAEKQRGAALKLRNVNVEMNKAGLIGEHYSLIFFPVWIFSLQSPRGNSEIVVDGLSHSVIKGPKKEPLIPTLNKDTLRFEQEGLRFIPFRCPVCGWDLPFHPYNVIHLCTTCGRAWREERNAYKEVVYKVVKGKGNYKEETVYLPFWTFHVSLIAPTEKISTVDAFYRYFPVPRVINKKSEMNRKIKFYIPAFRIKNIPAVNKLSTLFTQNQPQSDYVEKEVLLNSDVGGVFLSAKEAKEMAEILLFSLIPTNSRKAKKFVSHARIHFIQNQLEWRPFVEKGIYLREKNTGYAIQKGAVEIP